METKKCLICRAEFIPKKSIQVYCYKPCNPKTAWKINNREKDLQCRREYNHRRKLNPTNVAKDKLCSKRWNAEVRKKGMTSWQKNNRDKLKFYKYKRRALIKISNKFSAQNWRDMKSEHKNTCLSCSQKEPNIILTIDHIIPLSKGGTHEKKNIQPLCNKCNLVKNARTIDYRKV